MKKIETIVKYKVGDVEFNSKKEAEEWAGQNVPSDEALELTKNCPTEKNVSLELTIVGNLKCVVNSSVFINEDDEVEVGHVDIEIVGTSKNKLINIICDCIYYEDLNEAGYFDELVMKTKEAKELKKEYDKWSKKVNKLDKWNKQYVEDNI